MHINNYIDVHMKMGMRMCVPVYGSQVGLVHPGPGMAKFLATPLTLDTILLNL